MNQYEYIIIGFGKGGKTLATFLAKQGKKVALIDKSEKMVGGTCINVGCIPSKSLVFQSSQIRKNRTLTFEERALEYKKAIEYKQCLVEQLRQKNYQMIVEHRIDFYLGVASFLSSTKIEVRNGEEVLILEGEKILINTGASPRIDSKGKSNR